jgi:hypothetical protein
MHFDHVRGEKLFNISRCAWHGITLAKLKVEIAKCDVVCANCHAIRTHERRVAEAGRDGVAGVASEGSA